MDDGTCVHYAAQWCEVCISDKRLRAKKRVRVTPSLIKVYAISRANCAVHVNLQLGYYFVRFMWGIKRWQFSIIVADFIYYIIIGAGNKCMLFLLCIFGERVVNCFDSIYTKPTLQPNDCRLLLLTRKSTIVSFCPFSCPSFDLKKSN